MIRWETSGRGGDRISAEGMLGVSVCFRLLSVEKCWPFYDSGHTHEQHTTTINKAAWLALGVIGCFCLLIAGGEGQNRR